MLWILNNNEKVKINFVGENSVKHKNFFVVIIPAGLNVGLTLDFILIFNNQYVAHPKARFIKAGPSKVKFLLMKLDMRKLIHA